MFTSPLVPNWRPCFPAGPISVDLRKMALHTTWGAAFYVISPFLLPTGHAGTMRPYHAIWRPVKKTASHRKTFSIKCLEIRFFSMSGNGGAHRLGRSTIGWMCCKRLSGALKRARLRICRRVLLPPPSSRSGRNGARTVSLSICCGMFPWHRPFSLSSESRITGKPTRDTYFEIATGPDWLSMARKKTSTSFAMIRFPGVTTLKP